MAFTEYLVELENVCKSYTIAGQNRLQILHDVCSKFPRNAWNILLGASGSGKTTLLNLIGALESPDSGTIRFAGTDYAELVKNPTAAARFRNRRIGFIFQNYQLMPEFTILENVMLPGRLADMPLKKSRDRAVELLETLDLADRLHHRPTELSGGEQQRAAVARALLNDPELILADEPTGNLDSQTGEKLLELFRKLSTDHTIIMITHNEALTSYADKVFRLADGRLSNCEKPDGMSV